MELTGAVSIVTGGARGIGRGIATSLAREGARVVIADRLSDPSVAAMADETMRQVEMHGVEALALDCDVTSEEQVRGAIEQVIDRFGRIDVACANAGVIRRAEITDSSRAAWDHTIGVNLTGAYLLAKSVSPVMIEQKAGVLVNVSSIAAFHGSEGYSAYCASKAGLLGLTRALARELAPSGVRVNAVCPGHLATAMWSDTILPGIGDIDQDEMFRAVIAAAVPLRRPQTPEDIGRAVVYLCEADNVTGIALPVDGGHLS